MPRWAGTTIVTLLLAVFAGCGGGGSEGGSDGGSGPGTYVTEQAGAKIAVQLPVQSDDPAVAQIEGFRSRAGQAQPTYAVMTIDNTAGQEQQSGESGVTVVTDDGQQIELKAAWQLVGNWQDSQGLNSTSYNEGVSLYNALLKSDDVLPGARARAALATDQPLPSIKAVFLANSVPLVELKKG